MLFSFTTLMTSKTMPHIKAMVPFRQQQQSHKRGIAETVAGQTTGKPCC